jgi:hypothetical protein
MAKICGQPENNALRALVMAKTCGQPENNALRALVMAKTCGQPEKQRVTGPRYGKNLRAAREQRVTGPHFQLLDWSRFNVPSPVAVLRDLVKQKSNGSQRTTRFGTSFSAPLLAGFHVPSRIPLLRDLGTQSLRAAKEQRVTGPHFQLLDWSRFKSRHG